MILFDTRISNKLLEIQIYPLLQHCEVSFFTQRHDTPSAVFRLRNPVATSPAAVVRIAELGQPWDARGLGGCYNVPGFCRFSHWHHLFHPETSSSVDSVTDIIFFHPKNICVSSSSSSPPLVSPPFPPPPTVWGLDCRQTAPSRWCKVGFARRLRTHPW